MRELTNDEIMQVAGAGFEDGYFSLKELASNTAGAAAIGGAVGFLVGGPVTAAATSGGAATATFFSMAVFNTFMSGVAAYEYATQCF